MDPREPQPPHPHTHHRQLKNVAFVGPNPFANIAPNTMVEPINAEYPPHNMNRDFHSHYEPFNNNVLSNLDSSVNVSSGPDSIKKKRGRPRKYFTAGNITLGSSSIPAHDAAIISPSSTVNVSSGFGSIQKKRGRPRKYFSVGNITLGSSSVLAQDAAIICPSSTMKKNQQAEMLGVTGTGFSAHSIIVNRGEDIVTKLATCCQGGPNTEMCILSAHGLVGIASFHQSGVIVTYEGQFELVSLSGMLEVCDNNSGYKRMGNFKVSLVGPDLRPLGGVVANKLIAASSVNVTVGSFTVDAKKASPNNLKIRPSSVPSSQFATSRSPTGATLQGPSYEFSGDNQNSPFSQGLGSYNNASQPIPTMAMYQKSLARQTQ